MPLEFGDIVIARFRLQHAWGTTLSLPRPCLVIRAWLSLEGGEIEVAYGTSAPEYSERYNAQIIRHDAGEIGAWPPGAFLLRRRRVLPKTPEFFPEGAAKVAALNEAKRLRAGRALEELATIAKWETAHGGARRAELSIRPRGMV